MSEALSLVTAFALLAVALYQRRQIKQLMRMLDDLAAMVGYDKDRTSR